MDNVAEENWLIRGNMALKLTVPTLEGPDSAKALKETILTSEPEARVDVDAETKTVTVESQASEETFKQLIIAAGHQLAWLTCVNM